MPDDPQPFEITPEWVQQHYETISLFIRQLPEMRAVHRSERDDVVQETMARIARKKRGGTKVE